MVRVLSRVAGIIDKNGNLRVVVTDGCLNCHIANMQERLFVVPGLFVQEPVNVRYWPELVKIVEDYVKQVA